jgi:mannose-6-phosphate isomerase
MELFQRPWGWYENLQNSDGYKVKTLFVKPNEKISLQYHFHRYEHWIVVRGNGFLELDKNIREIKVGDYIFIPKMSIHRVSSGKDGIMIIEVQQGQICEEEDIVRIQDEYGRI